MLKGLGAQRAAVERYRRTSQVSLAATLRAARAEAWQTGLVPALTGGFIARGTAGVLNARTGGGPVQIGRAHV